MGAIEDVGALAEPVRRRREVAFLEGDDNPAGMHLTGRQAATAGEQAGVAAVLLTHVPPWHDPVRVLTEATPSFSGPTSLAVAGGVWSIGD